MTLRTFFMAVALLAASASGAAAAEVRYTGATNGHDPFAAMFQPKKLGEGVSGAEQKVRALTVEGVVTSAKNPRAIIGNKIYRVGAEVLPGIKISQITKAGVFVQVGDKEIMLNRPSSIAKGKTTDELPKKPLSA